MAVKSISFQTMSLCFQYDDIIYFTCICKVGLEEDFEWMTQLWKGPKCDLVPNIENEYEFSDKRWKKWRTFLQNWVIFTISKLKVQFDIGGTTKFYLLISVRNSGSERNDVLLYYVIHNHFYWITGLTICVWLQQFQHLFVITHIL